MPFRITIKDHYLSVAWFGRLTREDLGELLRALPAAARQCRFRPDVLHTFDAVEDADFGSWDVQAFSLRRQQTPIPVRVKSAIVAPTPVARAMARVFQGLNRNPNLVMEVFPGEAEALAWLAEGEPGHAPE